MSKLTTNLATPPYTDDYDENKNFYRILFRSSVAVQARELTQIQTILQNQISKFGDHVFKDGSVVDGCGITYFPNLDFVRIRDRFEESTTRSFEIFTTNVLLVAGNDNINGARAVVLLFKSGTEANYPATNRLYLKYIKTGKDAGGNDISTFLLGQTIHVYNAEQEKLGNLDPAKRVDSFRLINNTVDRQATGNAYGISVSDGIVYQKGTFVKVKQHTITVSDYDTNVTNKAVGFETSEEIVNEFADPSLYDIAQNSPNFRAPGAHRLKLIPTLVVKEKTADLYKNFFSIVEFDNGEPTEQRNSNEYNKLGDVLAKRTYEESGNYVVKPFNIETLPSSNASTFLYEISSGIGFASGYRVELLNSKRIEAPRALTTSTSQNQAITTAYGNYVIVDEVSGSFNTEQTVEVDLFDTVQRSITEIRGISGADQGTSIGKANVVFLQHSSGSKGAANGRYFLYLTNIRMNSGFNFSSVRSIVQTTSSKARADVILENGIAVLKDSGISSLVFKTGYSAVKDVTDVSYTIQQNSTATLNANGFVTFTADISAPGGTERLVGPVITDVLKQPYKFFFTANTFTANLSGTVSVNSGNNVVVGTGTSFLSHYANGDYIRIYANSTLTILTSAVNVVNNTFMIVANTISSSHASVPHARFFVAGQALNTDGSNCTINILSNTQFTASFSFPANLNSSQTIQGTYPLLRNTSSPARKEVRRGTVVRIDCSNNIANTTGPWNLGLVDAFGFRAYVGATFANTNPNRSDWFTIDTGQREFFYDHARLVVKPEHRSKINAATRILVEVDHFIANTATSVGYFNVNSYPVNDAPTANTALFVKTVEIPNVNVSDGTYSLRDAIDFRFVKTNTANVTNILASSSINPTANTLLPTNTKYHTGPSTSFTFDVENYLPRFDVVSLNKEGDVVIRPGTPSVAPTVPFVEDDTLKLAEVYVPAYPSITQREGEIIGRVPQAIKINLTNTRRYTMRDIGVLDERLRRVEYYTVLSALERSAKDQVVLDANGLDRFKNGIFADAFNSHLIGNVSDFEYKISIDTMNSIARPSYKTHSVDYTFSSNNSTGVKRAGNVVTRDFTPETYINQRFATKIRNLTGALWQWNGNIDLFPAMDHFRDETRLPNINSTIDLAAPWEQFAQTPFAAQFGEWRTVSSSGGSETTIAAGGTFGDWRPSFVTNSWWSEVQQQQVTRLQVNSSTNTINFGDYVSDFTLQPYMRSRLVAFIARNLKPNTRVYAFFDRQPVSQHCAPGVLSGLTNVAEGRESDVVDRIGNFGDPIVADSTGFACGIFRIPENTFRTGDRTFQLTNVNNLETGVDAMVTIASSIYSASNLAVTRRTSTLTTRQPEIRAVTNLEGSRTVSGGSQTVEFFDPLAQTFFTNMPGTTSGVYITDIDLFFKTVDPVLGCTVYIMEVTDRVPDPTMILGKAYRPASYFVGKTSEDASIPSTFIFDSPIFLAANKEYAFMVEPDGNSPEYNIWIGEAGGVDVLTNEQVFANPYIGVCFISSNRFTWTPIQKEDVKFTMRRAKFDISTSSTMKLRFENEGDDYLTLSNVVMSNSSMGSIAIGDIVYRMANSTVANTNPLSYKGYVQAYNPAEGSITIDVSSGSVANNVLLGFYRPVSEISEVINASTSVATAVVQSVNDLTYNAIVPAMSTIVPLRTRLKYTFLGTSNNYVRDTTPVVIEPGTETELLDYPRIVVSRSNEIANMSGQKSTILEIELSSEDDFLSPVVDLGRKSNLHIQNIVNNDTTNEHTRYGNAQAKYISRTVILADGQDAEDLMVYITASRPVGSDIAVYGKFLNSSDPDTFEDKLWTRLQYLSGGESVFTSSADPKSMREYVFGLRNVADIPGTAFKNQANNGVLEYVANSGSIYRSFKSFAVKVVLLSNDSARIPRLDDIRVIALQI